MRVLSARFLAVASLFLSVALVGCGKQQEGERCGDDEQAPSIDNDDCDDGLVCKFGKDLLNGNGANRCCYPGTDFTDSRCEPTRPGSGSGAGGAGTGGAGSAEAGAPGEGS